MWRCQVGPHQFIIKICQGHSAAAFSVQSTYQLQQRLYQQDLAAKPYYLAPLNAHQTLWIEQYVAAAFDHADSTNPIQPLCDSLWRLHQQAIDPTLRQVDPLEQAQRLFTQLKIKCETGTVQEPSFIFELETRLAALTDKFTADANGMIAEPSASHTFNASNTANTANLPVLCHNDLQIEHVRAAGVMIDWEYAGAGSRYYDLVNCILINELDTNEQAALIQTYADISAIPQETVQVQCERYLPLAHLINTLWHCLIDKQ